VSVEVLTFGCRLNAYESEVMRGLAGAQAGAGDDADTIVVNTCAVTAEAERQARQAIRRARREHPGARIIVTGCAATLSPERYAALGEVDLVLDNDAKLRAESYAIAPHPPAGDAAPSLARTAGEGARGQSPRAGEGLASVQTLTLPWLRHGSLPLPQCGRGLY
jgi:Uncharacterized protein family UPF0004